MKINPWGATNLMANSVLSQSQAIPHLREPQKMRMKLTESADEIPLSSGGFKKLSLSSEYTYRCVWSVHGDGREGFLCCRLVLIFNKSY